MIKLDNRVNKLKSVLERQNEVVDNQAREFEEVRRMEMTMMMVVILSPYHAFRFHLF